METYICTCVHIWYTFGMDEKYVLVRKGFWTETGGKSFNLMEQSFYLQEGQIIQRVI